MILVVYSMTLEPYTNTALFNEKYLAMSYEQSVDFYKLREEMLTSKYRILDTGILFILISSLSMILLKIGNGRVLSPSKRSYLIILAVLLPIITVSGFVFDLFQGMLRTEFPHWADSFGIPLMGVPIQLTILLTWSLAHLGLAKESRSLPISTAFTLKLNPWLIFVTTVTIILTILAALEGIYWYAIPGVLWLYYYVSLGVNRLAVKST